MQQGQTRGRSKTSGRAGNTRVHVVRTTDLVIERIGPAQEMALLREINRAAKPRRFEFDEDLRIPFDSMRPGDSVFVPGYTTNERDDDPNLRKISIGGYHRGRTKVWSVRSTVERGIKGVRVYRDA